MAALLLDTHAALWWWRDVPELSGKARTAIADASEIYVSVASALEIATKWRLGKLGDIGDPAIHYPRLMDQNRFTSLPVGQQHALRAGLLSGDHRDPFDRLIAAQALVEGLHVVTRDPAFVGFGCETVW